MIERLIELLKEADDHSENIMDYNEAIADNAAYLLSKGVIVPPFPIGTTYYRICTKRAKVCSPYFSYIREAKLNYYNIENVIEDFGKTVFLSRTEAEAALQKMNNSKNSI